MGKSKPAVETPTVTTDAPSTSWWERTFQPRRIGPLALLAVIGVIVPWIVRQLPDLRQQPEYQLPFSQIELDPAPSEAVPADLATRVQRRSQMPETVSLLDPVLPRTLAEAFAEHPWIERVIEVRNQYPAHVVVRVDYRHPVAVVLVQSGLYPIDGEGVLLPPNDFTPESVQHLIAVRGVATTPYAEAGKRWTDPAVLAAADLARYLGPRWQELQLKAIIVSPAATADTPPEEIPLELETAGGSRILWGRAPDAQHPGELTGDQKLGRLEKYLAEFDRFDRPSGPYEIDIRHWEEISRKPLATPANTATRRTERARQ